MLPTAQLKYGTWPRSGHIVVVDSRGNENLNCTSRKELGRQQVEQVVFLGPNGNQLEDTRWKKFV